jgi:hypothetical protein
MPTWRYFNAVLSQPPDAGVLIAGVVIAVVAALALALVFGMSRRTIAVAIGLTIGVAVFYPGGTRALVVDALRPIGGFFQTERDRSAAHDAAIGRAADGWATARTR